MNLIANESLPVPLKTPALAVVILTHNEELNLPHCLASVAWIDEVIVVDSGSQDRTVEIAKAAGVSVLVRQIHPFLISEQRNYALDRADITAEWVLFLDADEQVTPTLKHTLQAVLQTAPPNMVAYRLAPKFMFLGRWLKYTQGYPSWHDRLIRYGKVRFTGGVWESFELLDPATGRVGYIHEPYLHYSVNKGIDDWFAKHSRYASVEALDMLTTLGETVNREGGYEQRRTMRKRTLRNLAALVWPLRPIIRFFIMYVGRLGFLDGRPGLLFSLLIACYEFIIVLKVIELRRRAKGMTV